MDRSEMEELWRRRIAEAKLRFDSARSRTNAVVREFALDGTSADGRYAYRNAIRVENVALAEYNRVLRIYTDLMHDGIASDEDDWARRQGASSEGSTE